ncbi:hypothetical protein RJT34_16354 [Clitoria ternatea]|uniref:Uncharacterized protein n=1 Tax=Clitoria ternatea TaxID=43366 RepID=A0AAN9J912_CLITE
MNEYEVPPGFEEQRPLRQETRNKEPKATNSKLHSHDAHETNLCLNIEPQHDPINRHETDPMTPCQVKNIDTIDNVADNQNSQDLNHTPGNLGQSRYEEENHPSMLID